MIEYKLTEENFIAAKPLQNLVLTCANPLSKSYEFINHWQSVESFADGFQAKIKLLICRLQG
jgi:hypothetical protein